MARAEWRITPADPEWADVEILAYSYQRRQDWKAQRIGAATANSIMIALGLTGERRPTTQALANTSPRPGGYIRSASTGQAYQVVSPFDMERRVNGI